jgi:sigma-E factor negative regulatory protein RseA
MDERLRESLSALMDDEANELELERILSRIGDDGELRASWTRYNHVRSAVAGQTAGLASMDISQEVRNAIAVEPVSAASKAPRQWMRPMASFAVAASVTAAVVLGGQQLALVGEPGGDNTQVVARMAAPQVLSTGGTANYVSYGGQSLQPAAKTAYRELARQRMQKYMQQHAEHAALNSPQGLIPFARVPQISE